MAAHIVISGPGEAGGIWFSFKPKEDGEAKSFQHSISLVWDRITVIWWAYVIEIIHRQLISPHCGTACTKLCVKGLTYISLKGKLVVHSVAQQRSLHPVQST